jgi:hypothetical protein
MILLSLLQIGTKNTKTNTTKKLYRKWKNLIFPKDPGGTWFVANADGVLVLLNGADEA